jgi:hypothetical protein
MRLSVGVERTQIMQPPCKQKKCPPFTAVLVLVLVPFTACLVMERLVVVESLVVVVVVVVESPAVVVAPEDQPVWGIGCLWRS